MKEKLICISAPDGKTCRTGGGKKKTQQNIKIIIAIIVDSFM